VRNPQEISATGKSNALFLRKELGIVNKIKTAPDGTALFLRYTEEAFIFLEVCTTLFR